MTESAFNWIQVCENIADIKRCKLDEIFELPIQEFMNLMSYLTWKNKKLEKQNNNNGIQ